MLRLVVQLVDSYVDVRLARHAFVGEERLRDKPKLRTSALEAE